MAVPEPPLDLNPGGQKIWRSIHEQLGESGWTPERTALAHELARLKDRADDLDQVTRLHGPLITDDKGRVGTNPAYVEARQTGLAMARLTAALQAAFAAKRSRGGQHGVRGTYQPRSEGAGTVTAIDRARNRATGA